MPGPHHPKYPAWSGLSAAQRAARDTRPRESWWVSYAVGSRRDEEFMADAEKLAPSSSDGVELKIWVSE